jgi:sarcosine oxidase subunit alpha
MLQRPALQEPDRLQLVGVIARGNNARMPYGAQIVPENRPGPQGYVGHVTSMAYSPNLEAHIGLALVRGGRGRHGELLYATSPTANKTVQIEIVPPVFIDPEGERLNA